MESHSNVNVDGKEWGGIGVGEYVVSVLCVPLRVGEMLSALGPSI